MCSMGREETTFHLFFSYPFSHQCWRHLNINWNVNLDLYSMMTEATFHLFFSYPFSHQCWRHLNINWNVNLDLYSMMTEAREQFNSSLFMEIFMIAAWLIHKQRNDHIFNRARPAFDRWKAGFQPLTKLTECLLLKGAIVFLPLLPS
jgi:hypothetical protein